MLKKIISLLIVLNSYTLSQEFGMGLLLDDSLYANSPTAAPLMRGDYSDLPKSSSLKDKCPTPGYQGQYGTCAGWSTAFAGRTILEALKIIGIKPLLMKMHSLHHLFTIRLD